MSHRTYAVGLGSNLGDRLKNLTLALEEIQKLGAVVNVAPIFENPPLLPQNAPDDWYHFFLNTVVTIESPLSPQEMLFALQKIEVKLGRPKDHAKWSPRTIDLDLIFCDQKELREKDLTLPHPAWKERAFVTAPLFHLSCGKFPQSIAAHRQQSHKIPALMAAINVTPDSFSQKTTSIEIDSILKKIESLLASGVGYLDIGAESTRPGATPLTSKEEKQRLHPLFEAIPSLKKRYPFTKFSIDTYHPETTQAALEVGFDILNDVGGLKNPQMQELAKNFSSAVLMHSLVVPADPKVVLAKDTDLKSYMQNWLNDKIYLTGLKPEKVIFDPGIGFGMSSHQSLFLLQSIAAFTQMPSRVLVGHSRKSFMKLWTDLPPEDRDIETLATSVFLAEQGVDILRVHNIELHQRILRSYHAVSQKTF